ncbi:MAG TPA: tetratricopeptide repeat protein [Blastocatellia bacterium]|nr:tetratricopeptide repeat protein [Blastocatellia bacterium]
MNSPQSTRRNNLRRAFYLRVSLLLCLVILTNSSPVFAQQRRATVPRRPQAQPASPGFAQLETQAGQAREAGDLDEAIRLYRKGVTMRPDWREGWWYLATLLYEKDQYPEAARAFKRVSVLTPKVGAPLVMLGLCEFKLQDYDNALSHIRQGRQLGIGNNEDLGKAMRYHEACLMLLKGDFDNAQGVLNSLSFDNVNTENLIIAHGLAALRIPQMPNQIGPGHRDRELIRRAGYAAHLVAQKNMGDAQQEYERLVADYPKSPNVQYAWGGFLYTQRNEDGAVTAFKREIENSPGHALARLQIAWIALKNKDAAGGLAYAEEAVKLHPRLPLGHYILGRLLFETGENTRAIEELEAAQKLAPGEPKIYFSLSRAYVKAGRKADADRARETFARLNKVAEEAAAARGFQAIDEDKEGAEKSKPNLPRQ